MGLITKEEAISKLLEGTPVALPTETVYGLAAPIDNQRALQKIFSIKNRPLTDPLIIHVSSLEMALGLIETTDPDYETLAKEFWPGPLTLISKKNSEKVTDLITAGLKTVAIRQPESLLFSEIIKQTGPLAAPSANLFKAVSPTHFTHIIEELPDTFVVKGEVSKVGIESTIYDVQNKTVLRPGAITADQISKVIKKDVNYSEQLMTPGSEKDHYQPKQEVWVFESEELLNKNLSQPHSLMPFRQDPKDASKNLYQDLRDCDQNKKLIFTIFKPEWRKTEDWLAFENRLKKASTKWFS